MAKKRKRKAQISLGKLIIFILAIVAVFFLGSKIINGSKKRK